MDKPLSLSVQEPWLELIETGRKVVEGRAGRTGQFDHWIGRTVRFYSRDRIVDVRVIDIVYYATLYDYLDKEGWQNAAPHLLSRDQTIDAYHKFYTDRQIAQRGGMCAIRIELVH